VPELEQAYQRGDFAVARRQAQAVLADAAAPEADRKRAQAILADIRSDPAVLVAAALSVIGYVAVVLVFVA